MISLKEYLDSEYYQQYLNVVDENVKNAERVKDLLNQIKELTYDTINMRGGYEQRIKMLEAWNKELTKSLITAENLTPKTYHIQLSKDEFDKFKKACEGKE